MGGWSSRQAALGAFAVVILWLVGFFIAGTPPKFAAPPEQIVHYYVTHHHQVLVAVVLVAIGIVVYLAVLAQLSLLLRGAGERYACGDRDARDRVRAPPCSRSAMRSTASITQKRRCRCAGR